jgi:hypothetical protein
LSMLSRLNFAGGFSEAVWARPLTVNTDTANTNKQNLRMEFSWAFSFDSLAAKTLCQWDGRFYAFWVSRNKR